MSGRSDHKPRGRGPRGRDYKPRGGRPGRRDYESGQSSEKKAIIESQKQKEREDINKAEKEIADHEAQKKIDKIPLEKRVTKARNYINELEEYPDISSRWVQPFGFVPFFPEDNEKDEIIDYLNEDLSVLLRLDYKYFWSQVIFDQSLTKFLDTYLRFSRRDYDLTYTGKEIEKAKRSPDHANLFERVFKFVLRLTTPHESDEDFMSAEYFADVIYNKCHFDLPKILDFTSLYSNYNFEEVQQMITRLFTLQPKYTEELSRSVPALSKVMEESRKRLEKKLSPVEIDDVLVYLIDLLVTINLFCTAYPPAVDVLVRSDFVYQLALNYDTMIPLLEHMASKKFVQQLHLSMGNTLVEKVVFELTINPSDKYLWDSLNQIAQGLTKNHSQVDNKEIKLTFAKDLNYYYKTLESYQKLSLEYKEAEESAKLLIKACGADKINSNENSQLKYPISALEEIQQILGEKYGTGFIYMCMEHYNGDSSAVINRILEGNLPPNLASAKRNATIKQFLDSQKKTTTDSLKPLYADKPNALPKKKMVQKQKGRGNARGDMSILDDKSDIKAFKDKYTDQIFEDEDAAFEQRLKSFSHSKNEEPTYEDEPDDSLNQFESFTVADGEAFSEDDESDSDFSDEDRPMNIPPGGIGRGRPLSGAQFIKKDNNPGRFQPKSDGGRGRGMGRGVGRGVGRGKVVEDEVEDEDEENEDEEEGEQNDNNGEQGRGRGGIRGRGGNRGGGGGRARGGGRGDARKHKTHNRKNMALKKENNKKPPVAPS